MKITISQIQRNLDELVNKEITSDFIYELMVANGIPKGTVKLLKGPNGAYNQCKDGSGRIISKNKMLYEDAIDKNILTVFDELKKYHESLKNKPRYIVTTNHEKLRALDTVTGDDLDIKMKNINEEPWFFASWGGVERVEPLPDNPDNVKAAEKMANIYVELVKHNRNFDINSMNALFTRLLFCFFAEDTSIFSQGIFTKYIKYNSKEDGSDLGECLNSVFRILGTEDHSSIPAYLSDFPYAGGSLFNKESNMPKFSPKARRMIIKSGEMNWSQINPDIFGSIFQGVMDATKRGTQGMHYTSVPNIMKVIKPLFLDGLYEDLRKAKGHKHEENKLKKLLARIRNMKIFDPACGSGDFLIVSYKELRKFEMKIFERIKKVTTQGKFYVSEVSIKQFFGIELDESARELSIVSMYIALHQMNTEFESLFKRPLETLPLDENDNIFRGNACQIDWEDVCPKDDDTEIYIVGNPPYSGHNKRADSLKEDMKRVFYDQKNFGRLDYIASWFRLASRYIKNSNVKFAFVSTNSICQGSQVILLWESILAEGQSIEFAYQSFKWSNNAKGKASVSVVIICVANNDCIKKKYLFSNIEDSNEQVKSEVNNISPYLKNRSSIIIRPREKPLSNILTPMKAGSSLKDGGKLTINSSDFDKIPADAMPYIKGFTNAEEFLDGVKRYCILISEETKEKALAIPFISERVEECRKFRLNRTNDEVRNRAQTPWKFARMRHRNTPSLLLPMTTTKKRKYIPIGFMDENTVISDSSHFVPDASLLVFGILSSRIHVLWVRETGGELGDTGIRYSSSLAYNTFPIPELTTNQKQNIENNVYNVIGAREKHTEMTVAEMYNPETMPADLRQAHEYLDLAVEKCFQSQPFQSDEERITFLFKEYEKLCISCV